MALSEEAAELKRWREDDRYKQGEIADKLGISRSTYANWEAGIQPIPEKHLRALRLLGFQAEVSKPSIPAPSTWVRLPHIGYISASTKVDWTDPYASEDFEYVATQIDDTRECFTCRVASDSMRPFLQENDLLMFKGTPVPKVGKIVLYRSPEGRLTIKWLKHDGQNYILHATNPRVDPTEADGTCLGYLIGVYHQERPKYSIEEESGISPKDFPTFSS